jgi:hypothetical protein
MRLSLSLMGGKRTEAVPLLAPLLKFSPVVMKDFDKRKLRAQRFIVYPFMWHTSLLYNKHPPSSKHGMGSLASARRYGIFSISSKAFSFSTSAAFFKVAFVLSDFFIASIRAISFS